MKRQGKRKPIVLASFLAALVLLSAFLPCAAAGASNGLSWKEYINTKWGAINAGRQTDGIHAWLFAAANARNYYLEKNEEKTFSGFQNVLNEYVKAIKDYNSRHPDRILRNNSGKAGTLEDTANYLTAVGISSRTAYSIVFRDENEDFVDELDRQIEKAWALLEARFLAENGTPVEAAPILCNRGGQYMAIVAMDEEKNVCFVDSMTNRPTWVQKDTMKQRIVRAGQEYVEWEMVIPIGEEKNATHDVIFIYDDASYREALAFASGKGDEGREGLTGSVIGEGEIGFVLGFAAAAFLTVVILFIRQRKKKPTEA